MSNNVFGALLMMASMASFTFNDTFIKMTDGAVPLWQLLFLRGVLTTMLILGLGYVLRTIHFRMSGRDWRLIGMRCLSEIGAAYFFLSALFQMPLANAIAILQVLPLAVSLGAALFLGEGLGWRRMTAILIGFCGMLLIVRPGPDGFSIWSIYALLAVLCVTCRDLVTRQLSRDVPSLTVTLIAAISVTIFAGVASVPQGWAVLTPNLWSLIVGSSIFILGGYFFSVQVMRQGDISFIAPFRYTSLIFALALGWLIFDDWPDGITLIGAGIIVATGLFTLYRERNAAR
ncbi:MAG: DMT family transporter [Paracoccaceae bacterium]|uniref:DMT family transporter n=1 Tax=Yoonia sp. TaxID=2212373 RepID=UPI003266943C